MDPRKNIKCYGKGTRTSVLRKHLADAHIDIWVSGCDKLKISICAKEVLQAVANYRTKTGQETFMPTQPAGPEFSKEAFVDAIAEFIVADDQVIVNLWPLHDCYYCYLQLFMRADKSIKSTQKRYSFSNSDISTTTRPIDKQQRASRSAHPGAGHQLFSDLFH